MLFLGSAQESLEVPLVPHVDAMADLLRHMHSLGDLAQQKLGTSFLERGELAGPIDAALNVDGGNLAESVDALRRDVRDGEGREMPNTVSEPGRDARNVARP